MSELIKHFTDNEFQSEIKHGVTLVDFHANWCGPCRMLSSVLDDVSAALPDINIVKINVDELPEIANTYSVQSVPTLILFKDGKEIASRAGFASKSSLVNWINEH